MPFHFQREIRGDMILAESASFRCFFCCLDLLLRCRCCRINDRRIQHFSGRIDNCQLTAGTERRIPAKHHLSCDRRLHQKLVQILAKHLDRTIFRLLGQCIADLTLNCRGDQTAVTVCDRLLLTLGVVCGFSLADHLLFQITQEFALPELPSLRSGIFPFRRG